MYCECSGSPSTPSPLARYHRLFVAFLALRNLCQICTHCIEPVKPLGFETFAVKSIPGRGWDLFPAYIPNTIGPLGSEKLDVIWTVPVPTLIEAVGLLTLKVTCPVNVCPP